MLNHHQRFDGSGWPNMEAHTAGRIKGPLAGQRIHIVARIVAACNVLDNLLRDAKGQSRPPVAALFDFASKRFDGWFDPVIRRAVLMRIPPFAVGTQVRLCDGRKAVVSVPSLKDPCRPTVRILGAPPPGASPVSIDLSVDLGLHITHALGQEVAQYLYAAPPDVGAYAAPIDDAPAAAA